MSLYLDGVVWTALVLCPLAGDSVLVLEQNPVGGEEELVTDGLEGQVDGLILQEESRAILL